ncbi:Oberon PHD finger domain [Arabidopsis suecica]|uniref:Oberon PHD finger domain n=1 Tax=Arabidopsis suecica TaxID=45249 RepID=A0A8T2BC06_ARASU|nr:Oberon PHD finger domain [Arabidopsis suecica]
MASSHKGATGDSMGSSKMSFDQKRQLIYRLSKQSDTALKEVLKDWTCVEIRELLRAESEKNIKYTGLTKEEIIIRLFNIVSKKNTGGYEVEEERNPSPKRQRKDLDPLHYVTPLAKAKGKGTMYCQNLACQAKLREEATFCQRCSCCICYKYDNNKDPSLWLTCNSDPPLDGESCGLSCHLVCAFDNLNSGLKEDTPSSNIDGCFSCVFCGKENSKIECLKKQLIIANEERRVGVFCFRILMAHKLLKGTNKYTLVSEEVEEAVKHLETEFGVPLSSLPLEMSRGLINRLCCAKTVKGHCSSALKELECLPLPSTIQGSLKIKIESVLATSVSFVMDVEESFSWGDTNHYRMFHRKATERYYSEHLTLELFSTTSYPSFNVLELTPATEYCFKIVSFSGVEEVSVDEFRVSTQTLQEEEDLKEVAAVLKNMPNCENLSLPPPPSSETDRQENGNKMERLGFEQCVKLIRQLECSGKVKSDFRKKFLTWYGLRATAKEKHIVEIFVNTFKDDTVALAEKLINIFSDCISRKRPAIGGGSSGGGDDESAGLCLMLLSIDH